MDRIRWLPLLVVLLLAACHELPPRAAPAAEVALQPYAGRLRTVDLGLGGTPLRMLLDTGAGLTLLQPNRAQQLGCRAQGRSVGWRMNGERVVFPLCAGGSLMLGAFSRKLPVYGVFDLGSLLPPELPLLDGILGLDAFGDATVVLQLGRERILVEPGGLPPQAGWNEVPMRVASGVDGATRVVFLGVDAPDGARYWLELDSGNLDTVLLAPHTAVALGVGADGQARLSLGTTGPVAVDATVRELLHDGALNAAFLERFDVRLDLGAARAWLRPSASKGS